MIKLTAPETYTATIGGVEWSNITPASHMWSEVQDMITDGAEVLDLTSPPPPPPPTAADVKAEAHRRIVEILPEWKQRNLTAQAAQLAEKGRASWTDAELAAWDAGLALWAQVAAIRAASDAIEAMDPIPDDYADDRWWI